MNSNKHTFRTPQGGRSSFEVTPSSTGRGVDLIFRRSSDGELFVRLSWAQAEDLGKSIASVISAHDFTDSKAEA